MTRLRVHIETASLAAASALVLHVVLACASPPPPAPAVNNAPARGCAKDADCKGDRICEHGSCVSPR